MNSHCETVAKQVGSMFTCSELNGMVRIRSPLLLPDGDIIDVFMIELGSQVLVTDLGETLRWLHMQASISKRTKKQDRMIADIVLTHGVEESDGQLNVRIGSLSELGQAVIALSQACSRVADLWFTLRTGIFDTIADDVAKWLQDNRVSYQRRVGIRGSSGQQWIIDFSTQYESRSAFVTVLGAATLPSAKNKAYAAFSRWYDLREVKAENNIRFISLLDDTEEFMANFRFPQLRDFSNVVRWEAERDEFLALLTV